MVPSNDFFFKAPQVFRGTARFGKPVVKLPEGEPCGQGLTGQLRAPSSRPHSPQQVVLLGAVVGTERLQLSLPLAQLRQDLVLRVLCGAVLRFQQALGDQLLLDAALQGLSVRHAAGEAALSSRASLRGPL